jgi:hypothetical protein
MSKKKFVGVQFVETVRVGKRTFAFGVYGDHKVGRVPFAGLAEKNPEDKENPTRGRNLAIARAFDTLGKEIAKREWAKIKKPKTQTVKRKKFTEEEIAELRKKAKANDKASATTSKPKVKKNIEVG